MDALIEWFDGGRGRRIGLARHLSLSPATVSQWRQVPAEHCLAVEKLTGVSRHLLRPDVYGPQLAEAGE